MFTGIIQSTGNIKQIQDMDKDRRFFVESHDLNMSDLCIGDSIALSGVCLTVIEFDTQSFVVDVSFETIACTALGTWQVGQEVNLERAMQLSDRINGHLVSGHVDSVAKVMTITPEGRSVRYQIEMPAALACFISKKGSITVDGTSLTINEVDKDSFSVNIIPHTLEQTIIKNYQQGTRVNLEVDLLARYLQRLLECQAS